MKLLVYYTIAITSNKFGDSNSVERTEIIERNIDKLTEESIEEIKEEIKDRALNSDGAIRGLCVVERILLHAVSKLEE